MNKVLVTGSAGFIGSALCIRLLERGDHVIGLDNHNSYYDPALKEERISRHIHHPNYIHVRTSLEDFEQISNLFKKFQFIVLRKKKISESLLLTYLACLCAL